MLKSGRHVKARALIGGASFDPHTLKALYKAFDDAWEQVAPEVSARPEAIEAARMKLAEIVLGLANNGTQDADKLTEAAVRQMMAGPVDLA
jgi:hypothetical protein